MVLAAAGIAAVLIVVFILLLAQAIASEAWR